MKKIVLGFLLLSACQENEADFPEVNTHPVREIGTISVLLEAEIKEVGPVRPVNFGFVWSTQPSVTILSSDKYIVGSTSEPRLFSIKPDTFQPGTTYYYRGFAANADYSKIYYGNEVSFNTLP